MSSGHKSSFIASLSQKEMAILQHELRCTHTLNGVARRIRIVLLKSEGYSQTAIAVRVGVGRSIVRKWIQRYLASGIPGLMDLSRPGRPHKGRSEK
jgi:transposase